MALFKASGASYLKQKLTVPLSSLKLWNRDPPVSIVSLQNDYFATPYWAMEKK
jgi:hypothetical protein